MKKTIHLDSLALDVQVGIHDFEKAAPQPYVINVWLGLHPSYWCKNDRIEETVDYDALRQCIRTHLLGKAFNLQETIAQDILAMAFSLDDRVISVRVTVTKPTVYPDCQGVGLDYEMTRLEWVAWHKA